jgi:succinate-semialdehyde dehydrogenase/glutarate-semialdehyde dehydrogenase
VRIAEAINHLDPRHEVQLGGRTHVPASKFTVEDPATGNPIAELPNSGIPEVALAADAASAAFQAWAATSPRLRAELLRRAHHRMISDSDLFTALICAENGKSQADAQAEVAYAAEFFRWFSEQVVRTGDHNGASRFGSARNVVTHRPVGVATLITPWNFPAAMATRKIAPALAAGCTVILKPAAETPLTALAITDLLGSVGVPEGVVNVLPTTSAAPVVSKLLADRRVRKVSFTGSTRVGRALLKQAADRVLKVSMELGGNAPFVVTADADVAAAVSGAMVAKFRGGGQACTAANRFYIHTAVADEFIQYFGTAIKSLRVGAASDPATQVGPVITARAATTIQHLISRAVADGATIAARAEAPSKGHFVPPTLLTGVLPDAAIIHEEIFGPVAPIVLWDDKSQLLHWLNDTEYGLAAYVYSGRVQDALRIAHAIDAGMVGINRGVVSDPSMPFGGTKQSGLGREGGDMGMRAFQETQVFSMEDVQSPREFASS